MSRDMQSAQEEKRNQKCCTFIALLVTSFFPFERENIYIHVGGKRREKLIFWLVDLMHFVIARMRESCSRFALSAPTKSVGDRNGMNRESHSGTSSIVF